MKKQLKLVWLSLMLVGVLPISAFAHLADYPPFGFRNKQTLKYLSAKGHYKEDRTIVLDDNIRIKAEPFSEDAGSTLQRTITIYLAEGTIFNDSIGIMLKQNMGRPREIYYADLDNNGYQDIIIFEIYSGGGLAAVRYGVWILFHERGPTFYAARYDGYYSPGTFTKDFVDLNQDGKYEIIHTSIYTGKDYNYWVYNVYEIENYNLILANDKYSANFPKFIQATSRPNDKDAPKLPESARGAFSAELAGVIHSRQLSYKKAPEVKQPRKDNIVTAYFLELKSFINNIYLRGGIINLIIAELFRGFSWGVGFFTAFGTLSFFFLLKGRKKKS